MVIFIDNNYKCHTSNDGAMRAFDVEFFNNKCAAFVEGYRYIPEGETWTNPQGVKCSGISPWKPYSELAKAQAEYEAEQKATETEERIKTLEAENAMLMECLLEMSEVVYA